MNDEFLFILMIFLHIVDDYYLQGWLASAKQKKWWKENAPQELYKNDYIVALLMHSFSWAFMIMLPIAYVSGFNVNSAFITVFILNILIHAVTDNAKANLLKINLISDQTIHILQIVSTFILYASGRM
jgi:hypothetical protein